MNSKKALERIKEIVGNDLYMQLVQELSGAVVYFPNDGEWLDKNIRNQSIKEDYYSGKYEVTDIAKKYNLSISRIYKIIQQR